MESKQVRVLLTINLDKDFTNYQAVSEIGQADNREICDEYVRFILNAEAQDDIIIQDSEIILDIDNITKISKYKELLDEIIEKISNECSILHTDLEINGVYSTEVSDFIKYFEESKENQDKGIMFVGYTMFTSYDDMPLINEVSPHFVEQSDFIVKSYIRLECQYVELIDQLEKMNNYFNNIQGIKIREYIESKKGEM